MITESKSKIDIKKNIEESEDEEEDAGFGGLFDDFDDGYVPVKTKKTNAPKSSEPEEDMVGGLGGLFGDDEEYGSETNKALEITDKKDAAPSKKSNDIEDEAVLGFGGLFDEGPRKLLNDR